MTDDDTLTPAEAERIHGMIRLAAQLAHIDAAAELEILRLLAAGDRAGALAIRHQALTRSMMRELHALIEGGGRVPTQH